MSTEPSIWSRISDYIRMLIRVPIAIEQVVENFEAAQKKNEQVNLQLIRNQVLILNELHRLREDMRTENILLESRLRDGQDNTRKEADKVILSENSELK